MFKLKEDIHFENSGREIKTIMRMTLMKNNRYWMVLDGKYKNMLLKPSFNENIDITICYMVKTLNPIIILSPTTKTTIEKDLVLVTIC